MARYEHAYECWAGRPGGTCRTDCSCPCHRRGDRIERAIGRMIREARQDAADLEELRRMVTVLCALAPDHRVRYTTADLDRTIEYVQSLGDDAFMHFHERYDDDGRFESSEWVFGPESLCDGTPNAHPVRQTSQPLS